MPDELARCRARHLGLAPGVLPSGPRDAITDVAGVRVGHVTLIEGDAIRTGVTAILPHGGNLYQDKVPAGLAVGNGFGKLMGSTQLVELGEIETPLVLTNTLAVPQAAEAVIAWTLTQPGNEEIVSVNPVVGETNDSRLNDIRRRVVTPQHVLKAIGAAQDGPVAEGCVGAGTGTVAFGWKGGIGTSSRRLPQSLGDRDGAAERPAVAPVRGGDRGDRRGDLQRALHGDHDDGLPWSDGRGAAAGSRRGIGRDL